MKQPLIPKPLSKVKLADFDPGHVAGDWTKETAKQRLEKNVAVLTDLAYRLYAENRRSVLLILQGMDTSGKDGTIRNVMAGVNPHELRHHVVQAAQRRRAGPRLPLAHPQRRAELRPDRHLQPLALRGRAGRARPRSRPQVGVEARYDQINDFERQLVENGVTSSSASCTSARTSRRSVSKPAWTTRRSAGSSAGRTWKSASYWDDYQQAYEDALTRCNTEHAPWHIVPANRKWYRNLVVSNLLRKTLEDMNPQYPARGTGPRRDRRRIGDGLKLTDPSAPSASRPLAA